MSTDTTNCIIKNSIVPNERLIKRYLTFINYCKNIKFDGYTETHHIIPRSFNGSNDQSNLIKLGARHHYIAHLLLAKATNSPKMIKALHKMVYSKSGDVQRNYRINSRTYAYIRNEHAKVVSKYSKNTVVAKQIYTGEIKRIPQALFCQYNGILYEALAKGRRDSIETKSKKQKASSRPRKPYKQGLESRSIAASLYSYQTPKGLATTSKQLCALYPSFTPNTLSVIDNDVIITNKFASIHKEFKPYVGQTFKQYGLIKLKRKNFV